VHVKSALFPVIPQPPVFNPPPYQPPHSGSGDFFGVSLNFPDTGGASFGGQSVIPLHADITINVADNGAVDFNAPLGVLEASLDGDVVSITATLPDGQPLPDWLHFNVETGKFAGIVPDYSTGTGSLPQDGGDTGGHNTFPDKLTVEVVATDAKGDIAIIDFTINLKPDNGTHHGWNLPRDLRNLAPIELPHQHAQFLPQHGLPGPLLAAGGGHDHGAGHALAGRAGLSQQLAGHGLHGMHADRMALLESLRHATAGHG
jgi:Putative Ig domain